MVSMTGPCGQDMKQAIHQVANDTGMPIYTLEKVAEHMMANLDRTYIAIL